jgi:hypothetical protein
LLHASSVRHFPKGRYPVLADLVLRPSGGLEKRSCFDARNVKNSSAVLARRFVFHQDHVARRFGKLGAIPLVSVAGQLVDFFPQQPLQ